MNDGDDEIIGAYLDGELAEDEARSLERRLESDSSLRAQLDAYRDADSVTRKVYAAVDTVPMPDAVLQMLRQAPTTDAGNVVTLSQPGVRRFMQLPVALAAGIALVVGFLVSDLLQQTPGPGTALQSLSARAIDSGSDLHRLLERQPSGEAVTLGGGDQAQVVLSFEDQDTARFCRQLRIDASGSSAHAVACRHDGAWAIEALAFAAAGEDGQFGQASTEVPITISGTVDSLIGTAEPLEKEEENRLISEGWIK